MGLEATPKAFQKDVTKDAAAIRYVHNTATSIANYLRSTVLGKRPKLIRKGTKAAAAEPAAIATEAIAAVDLTEIKRLASEFEALGGGALTIALADAAAAAEVTAAEAAFSVRARVRVLAATVLGLLPRLVKGCGEAIVKTYNPNTREYTAKVLALY